MATGDARTPPGPADKYDQAESLLSWMKDHSARYGDIFKASIYGSTAYVVSSPEYAEHILLTNWRNYLRKGQTIKRIELSLGNGLISSNGEFWVRQRRMIQPAFTRQSIAAMTPLMAVASRALAEKWITAAEGRATVNVTREVSLSVLEVTLRVIFGDDYDRIERDFRMVAEESRDLAFAQTLSSLQRLVVEVVARRRSESRNGQDILGVMMLARDREQGEPMSDVQLAREALTLVIAGHETTASVLSWTWYLLARFPSVEARLARELAHPLAEAVDDMANLANFIYTRSVIQEALRLYPPLWLMMRKSKGADHLGEYFVPPGTEIYISPYLIQRHPEFWEAPEAFDPDRFGFLRSQERHRLAQCPFGGGPRNCIGELLALSEMQIHLMTIARRMRLRATEDSPVEWVAGVNLLSKRDFIMAPEVRVAPSPRELAGA